MSRAPGSSPGSRGGGVRRAADARGAGEDWSVDLAGAHHNQTVEFYVTASDYSNHAGSLGSEREPLKLKRKKWSLFGR